MSADNQRRRRSYLRTLKRQETRSMTLLYGDVQKPSVGLAISGGSTRSASFGSGVLRQLLADEVRIDFLSSVSGGGFVAASYVDWKYREGGKDRPEWHKRYFEHILGNVSTWMWRFDQSFRLGMIDVFMNIVLPLCNALILTPLLIVNVVLLLALAIDMGVGDLLRRSFDNDTGAGLPKERLTNRLLLLSFPALLLATSVCLRVLQPLLSNKHRPTLLGHALYTFFGIGRFLLTAVAQAWVLALVNTTAGVLDGGEGDVIISWSSFVYLAFESLYIVVVMLFPGSRLILTIGTVLVGHAVYLVVFYYHSDDRVYIIVTAAVWLSFVLTLASPFVQAFHDTLMFNLLRNNARRTFFHPKSQRGIHLDDILDVYPDLAIAKRWPMGARNSGELTFADLNEMRSPEWICQLVVNNWRYSATDEDEEDWKLLTVSSRFVDLIDQYCDKYKYLDVMPRHIRLSTGMAASAAVVSIYMGKFTSLIESLRELLVLSGIRLGIQLPVWIDPPVNGRARALKILKMMLVALLIPGPIYFLPRNGQTALLFFITSFVALFVSTFPTGYDIDTCSELHQLFFAISRWSVVNVPFFAILRDFFNIKNIGSHPGFLLHISDGGHIENLGLLALLKRRVNKIIIADGGLHNPKNIHEDLQPALQYAREWLGCEFTAMGGGDVEYDLLKNYVRPKLGGQPHCYKFKVLYNIESQGKSEVVDEGEILIVQPRHPDNVAPGPGSGDLDDGWTAEKADSLTGFCTRNTHGKWKTLSRFFLGVFPYFATHELGTMTPQMHEALHHEGLRAMSAPLAKDFIDQLPKRGFCRRRSTASETILESEDEISDSDEEKVSWVKHKDAKNFKRFLRRNTGQEPGEDELSALLQRRSASVDDSSLSSRDSDMPPLPLRNHQLNQVPLPPKDYHQHPQLVARRITAQF